MIDRFWERELELELWSKLKPTLFQMIEGSSKKPKTVDSLSRGLQGQVHCGKCGKEHNRVCRASGSGCFKCEQEGYFSWDCPLGEQICFHYNQTGHMKA